MQKIKHYHTDYTTWFRSYRSNKFLVLWNIYEKTQTSSVRLLCKQ